jgi:uncharacterized membrane protein
MAYCCRCGTQTGERDLYCGVCGGRTPAAAPSGDAISPRTASILCYIPVLGWIPAILVLASQRFRQDKSARFHAFQGIYLFVAWLVVDWVIGPSGWKIFHHEPGVFWFGHAFVGGILKLTIFAAWIFMLVKASEGSQFKLPLLGELAERSVAEQK